MRPGVLTVTVTPDDVRKYFVASGYAMVHAGSIADICAVEAVPVEQVCSPFPIAVQQEAIFIGAS